MIQPDTLYIPVADDVQLAATSVGCANNPLVLMLHGAGQTRHSWRSAAERLAQSGWRAVTLDTRGHGDSDWPKNGDYSVDTLVADLRTVLRYFDAPDMPVLVGASLGGICAMLAAGESAAPLFKSMVLVDITPRIDNTGVARIIEFMTRHQDGFSSVKEAAIAVEAYQMQARTPNTRVDIDKNRGRKRQDDPTCDKPRKKSDGLKKNLRLADDGRYYWHWDPRLMQHIGTIDESFYLRQRDAAANLDLPVLLIRGQQSEIVKRESVEEFMQLVPHAQFQDIADAAHMVAGDNNDVFASAVLDFIGPE